MKKQKQTERFELDQMPPILSGKAAPTIKKPFKQRAAEWMHLQAEACRRKWERYQREREQKRNTKPIVPSVGQLEKELNRARKSRRRMNAVRNALLTVLVLALMLCAAAAYFPVTRIVGDSMNPTLQNGEIILCERTQAVEPGDLVLFAGAHGQTWIKRVIARAGDEVDISQDGRISVNGEMLAEPYVSAWTRGDCDIEFPYIVPHGSVFVLGDHRALSIDSRHAIPGCVLGEQVIGRAVWRIYPFDRLGRIE